MIVRPIRPERGRVGLTIMNWPLTIMKVAGRGISQEWWLPPVPE
jgi:hypothetical protein